MGNGSSVKNLNKRVRDRVKLAPMEVALKNFNNDTVTVLKLFGYLLMEYSGISLPDIKTLVKLRILDQKPTITNKFNLFWNCETMKNIHSSSADSQTIQSWYKPSKTDGRVQCTIKLIQCMNIKNIFQNKKIHKVKIGNHDKYTNDNLIHKLLAFVIANKQFELSIDKSEKENEKEKDSNSIKKEFAIESTIEFNNNDIHKNFEKFKGMESIAQIKCEKKLPEMIICKCKNFGCCKQFNTILDRFKQDEQKNFIHLCNQFFGFYNGDSINSDSDYFMNNCYQCFAFFNWHVITVYGNPFCVGRETTCIAGLLKNVDKIYDDNQARIVLFTLETDTCDD